MHDGFNEVYNTPAQIDNIDKNKLVVDRHGKVWRYKHNGWNHNGTVAMGGAALSLSAPITVLHAIPDDITITLTYTG
jgi:hypothetical protein